MRRKNVKNESRQRPSSRGPTRARLACAQCGSPKVTTRVEVDKFQFGQGVNQVELSAAIPVHACEECGYQFVGPAAETARHNEICKHLGITSPGGIREIRKTHGLSRAEFAKLTRLGVATLGRWERGALLQNRAYDQFLYLLHWPDNLRRLRDRDAPKDPPADSQDIIAMRFPAIANQEDVSRRGTDFELMKG
jgi:putative zinc finger/helix-turn-helix YgiT family protein